jgi:hypothetical protein
MNLDKELQKLRNDEHELHSSVVARLAVVASGRDTMFFLNESQWASPNGRAILATARELDERAGRLGYECALAKEIIGAFERANDVSDHHRLGPIRLAQTLLERIELLRK